LSWEVFVLAWLASGWLAIAASYYIEAPEKITVKNLLWVFMFQFFGPVLWVIIFLMFIEKYGDKVLWRRGNNKS
jgi:hypothetical protein